MTSEQKKLLSLFKEIIEICERHNIVYYMAGGTLIGAMRHKGFIPWDDDMDLLMTRDNWHKFIAATRYDLPENRVLECQELDRDYPNMFGRYTDTTSSAIHMNQILGDGIAGYVVDILVLDPIPDKDSSYIHYRDNLLLYSDLVNPSLNYSYRYNVNKERFNKYFRKMKKLGKEAVLSEIEREIFSYPEEECQYYVMRWGGAPFLFDKDMYGSSRYGVFEGLTCRIPDRTGDYLTWHYGDDWMHIPHHSDHESHDAIFSFTTNYRTIQDDYLRYINVEKVRKSIIFRKKYLLRNMHRLTSVKDQRVKILSFATKCDIENAVATCGYDIHSHLKNEKYYELSKLFEKFYEEQLSRNQVGREDYLGISRFENPVFCGVSDDILSVAVMVLIHTNRVAKAARLLEIREREQDPIDEKLQHAKMLIGRIRSAISCYDLGRIEESFAITEKLFTEYPKNYNVIMQYIRLLLDKKRFDEADAIIRNAMDYFPKEGAFLKYHGDMIYRTDKKQAYEIYHKAMLTTSNGCTHLDIQELALSDKAWLTAEIKENLDLPQAELLVRLVGSDEDFYILKHEIILAQTPSEKKMFKLIGQIRNSLVKFDHSVKLLDLLRKYYIAMGETAVMTDFRIKFLMAKTVEDYHALAAELEDIPVELQDGNYFKMLGDVYSNLGLPEDAAHHWSMARIKPCSPLTLLELSRFFNGGTTQ
jgi:phosphorylcholine metabolism protein LicD